MEIRSWNNETVFANLLFSSLFRNIVIERRTGNVVKEVPVKCVIGNRSRVFKNLENPNKSSMYSLPLIVVTRTGITRNPDRLTNLHNEIVYQTNSNQHLYDLMTPVPIDISYTVTVISKYPSDNDMIMSNFLPFFNSDLFVQTTHPKFINVKYINQVILQDSISEEHPEDLGSDTDDITVTTFNFIFKTYIFGGVNRFAAGTNTISTIISGGTEISVIETIYDGFVPIINKINVDVHAVPWFDYTLPRLSNYVSTYISTETIYNPETQISTILSHLNVISGQTFIKQDYHYYDIYKYFEDFDNGLYKIPDVMCDQLRWNIHEDGIFRNSTLSQDYSWYIHNYDPKPWDESINK